MTPIGQTNTSGFQFGIRRTVPIGVEELWDRLFSPEGLRIWLGEWAGEPQVGTSFTNPAGVQGKLRVWKPYSHVRLDWQLPVWERPALLQLRVYGTEERATVAIHQERLADAARRAEMSLHWREVMEQIGNYLDRLH